MKKHEAVRVFSLGGHLKLKYEHPFPSNFPPLARDDLISRDVIDELEALKAIVHSSESKVTLEEDFELAA